MIFPHIFTAISECALRQVKAKELECWETDDWTIKAIMEKELLTRQVWDPCCGPGKIAKAAKRGHTVIASDVFDWGYGKRHDFLNDSVNKIWPFKPEATTIFMNPPFSKAVEFVERAFEFGARKIISFQRFSWYESNGRERFWDEFPCARIWLCGSRATCWRFGIPMDERNSGTPTCHAWFVWEKGQNTTMPPTGRIYKRAS